VSALPRPLPASARALALARALLAQGARDLDTWSYHALPGHPQAEGPWGVQMRKSADNNPSSLFLSSNVRGETLTGVGRSKAFVLPPKLSFYLAGHNGPPPDSWPEKNFVRLVNADTNQEIARAAPPRNDVARKVSWDLEKLAGRKAYFEAVDGDDNKAYAWLAFGRFDPPVLRIPEAGPRMQSALRIVESLHLTDSAGAVKKATAPMRHASTSTPTTFGSTEAGACCGGTPCARPA